MNVRLFFYFNSFYILPTFRLNFGIIGHELDKQRKFLAVVTINANAIEMFTECGSLLGKEFDASQSERQSS